MSRERDAYSWQEAQRRFESALRGARLVRHKSQSEMKLGEPRNQTEEESRH
jgi:hypothetical protein